MRNGQKIVSKIEFTFEMLIVILLSLGNLLFSFLTGQLIVSEFQKLKRKQQDEHVKRAVLTKTALLFFIFYLNSVLFIQNAFKCQRYSFKSLDMTIFRKNIQKSKTSF